MYEKKSEDEELLDSFQDGRGFQSVAHHESNESQVVTQASRFIGIRMLLNRIGEILLKHAGNLLQQNSRAMALYAS